MIVVVADDLTGAAEMAGVGLAHGLNVEINIEGYRDSSAELLVVAADTRSKPIPIVIEKITKLSEEIRKGHPELVYKKIDSVLRGHVLEEYADHGRRIMYERGHYCAIKSCTGQGHHGW